MSRKIAQAFSLPTVAETDEKVRLLKGN